jgi:hypothetical protein
MIGAVLGTVVGIGGGIFGTYCSIKNTTTATERRFMVGYAIVIWLAIIFLIFLPGFLSLLGIIPSWSQWALFVLFFLLLVPSIGWANRRQATLRRTDGQDAVPPSQS